MNILLVLTAAISLGRSPPQPAAGWQGAAWGMTPEQVAAAVPGIRAVRWGTSLSDARKRGVGATEVYGIGVEAEYFYGPDGLSFIRLDAPFGRCGDLVDGLLAEHGSPTEVSDQAILKLITWEDPDAGNRLVLLHSAAGICDLRIRSISEAGSGDN